MVRCRKAFYTICLLALSAQVAPLVAQKPVRPHAADQNLINFIRPGIGVKVVSAAIAADGTITARVTISDPKGLPLDMAGIATPGAVTLRLIAAYIPAGTEAVRVVHHHARQGDPE